MEKLKKNRATLRMAFTKTNTGIMKEISSENPNSVEIQANFIILEQKADSLSVIDKQIFEGLLELDCEEANLEGEMNSADEYAKSFNKTKIIYNNFIKASDNDNSNKQSVVEAVVQSVYSQPRRKYKLPMIEFKKFGDDVKEWLPFWAQFSKIDSDDEIADEDKFQYLIQATLPGSRARTLVESFPCTSENYIKVVDSLKARFGRSDLLVEVYVRELLKLILQNLNSQVGLSILYDKLESQLRALESLDVTSEKFAAMLYPLVESCIPEELLRVWQRSSVCDRGANLKEQLDNLMLFLCKEVENEQRISLAVAGFDMKTIQEKKTRIKEKRSENLENPIPTAAGLINYKDSYKCIFCDGQHKNEECVKAKKISVKNKYGILRRHKLCFICMKPGHMSRKCRSNLNCLLCEGKHVLIMCPRLDNNQSAEAVVMPVDKKEDTSIEKALSNSTHAEVILQTLVVCVKGNNAECRVRALIDTGSQRSYISQKIAKDMGYVSIGEENIIHALFGGSQSTPYNHHRYRVRLKNIHNDYACNFETLDQSMICGDISPVPHGPWKDELRQRGIRLTDDRGGPIDILIGADIAGKILTGHRHILTGGLVAVETFLGWTLMGKCSIEVSSEHINMTVTSLLSKEVVLSDLWSLDVLGIEDPIERKNRQELELAVKEHFFQTVKINNDGRYEVQMPWLAEHPPLSTNYSLAQRRLENNVKKLNLDGYYNSYCQVLKEWQDEGVIEEVQNHEQTEGHYLPHRAVIKLNSSTPVRPVFDASAKEKNCPSLNSCLEKGANLIELIPSILLRFRLNKIGVISDIRKAFLQISLHENDRNFLKFLWIDEGNNLKVFRHARVVFGVSCSPFLLGAVIGYHLKRMINKVENKESLYSLVTVQKLMKSFYVDNCVTSVSSLSELNLFINEATDIFLEGKFDLRCWEYTDPNAPVDTKLVSVLGLNWCRRTDTLGLSSSFLQEYPASVTKRVILSIAHRLFDPIGFSCPTSLSPRLLLQETWSLKIGWDSEVNDDIKERFLRWFNELHYLKGVRVPRWIFGESNDMTGWSLHTFCDASKVSYAAAVFLRVAAKDEIYIQLVQAKARVAPTKGMTIPRLELLAALIGARLAQSVISALDSSVSQLKCFFWSDSTTVISWIRRNDQWAVFVRNRVKEIHQLTAPDAWQHIPGLHNPADLPSRGCSAKKLLESRWWEGPSWLKNSMENWPTSCFTCDEQEINEEKMKGVSSLVVSSKYDDRDWYYKYFSKFNQICRMVAWVQRFVHNCRCCELRREGELSFQEFENAIKCVIKLVQRESFDGVKDKSIITLRPFEDDEGVFRLKTRISERNDIKNFRYPIVLPGNHPVVRRLIYEKHANSCHAGIQGLLSILREQYWIIKGRKSVRAVIHKCVTCRRYESAKLQSSPVSLPENRVRDAAVFEVTGVDLAGPLYLRGEEKAWICLFTCSIYRAVHLELVTSMSTNAFLQALRRFIARRGRPSTIYSDNGKYFVGAENAFSKLDWKIILAKSNFWRIEWRFLPPSSPWWGGWWERLIGLTKKLLRKVLGRACLKYEELQTVLCDCEAVINSRPLTYLSEDSKDMVPITPASFLQEIKQGGTLDCDAVESSALEQKIRHRQKVSQDLRKRFRNEYLGQLCQFFKKRMKTETLKKGDVVLIASDNTKRLDWPLAVVQELMPGRDGEVRLVRLKTSLGSILRPIQRVCLLETTPRDNKNICGNVAEERMGVGSESLQSAISDVRQFTRSGRQVKTPLRFL